MRRFAVSNEDRRLITGLLARRERLIADRAKVIQKIYVLGGELDEIEIQLATLTYEKIGNKFGIKRNTMSNWCKRWLNSNVDWHGGHP